MPELPEVETIRRGLSAKILNKKIAKIHINWPGTVKSDLTEFKKTLLGNRVKSIGRTGKLLIFNLGEKEKFLLIHLKMTGQLIYCFGDKVVAGGHSLPKLVGCLPNKYSHLWLEFSDHAHLFFNDMRKFGYLKLVDKKQLDKIISENYGIEPLKTNFKIDVLAQIIKGKQAPIKAVLLDQKKIAGIGNIYADEILFRAGIMPNRRANTLTDLEIKKIFKSANEIIKLAIRHRGTTFNDYADADGNVGNFVKHLKVYGRKGEKCLGCKKNAVAKMKVAGRGSYYCPECQK